MSLLSNRLVSIAISTVLLSLTSAAANAQIDVLTGLTGDNLSRNTGILESTYTFNRSMILNSIGFVTNGDKSIYTSLQYSIGGVNQSFNTLDLVDGSDGISWLTLVNPVTVLKDQQVRVMTAGPQIDFGGFPTEFTAYRNYSSIDSTSNVSYGGMVTTFSSYSDRTNSNLRVSNPGSNVAPEPGSFALALTGGVALIGICVRRRRNAG